MNDNLNTAKRRMIERNLKGVVREFIFSGKRAGTVSIA
jgi:hypothetical protein